MKQYKKSKRRLNKSKIIKPKKSNTSKSKR